MSNILKQIIYRKKKTVGPDSRKKDIEQKSYSMGAFLSGVLCLISFVSIFLIMVLGMVFDAGAVCVQGETLLKQQGMKQAFNAFETCALGENDDTAQIRLGQYYNGLKDPSDKMKALFYYHLAAENGNANAQVSLAKLLFQLQSNQEGKHILKQYNQQIKEMLSYSDAPFRGELLHPYTLLMLASENEGQKWYYPTTQKTNTEAGILLKKYQVSKEQQKNFIRQASLWKQKKMRETAYEVFSVSEYQDFMNIVYPKQGRPDAYKRQQAVEKLKEKTIKYLN